MMLVKISPTLDEILQVRGCPLEEDELWTLLRKIITDLHQTIQGKLKGVSLSMV